MKPIRSLPPPGGGGPPSISLDQICQLPLPGGGHTWFGGEQSFGGVPSAFRRALTPVVPMAAAMAGRPTAVAVVATPGTGAGGEGRRKRTGARRKKKRGARWGSGEKIGGSSEFWRGKKNDGI